MFGRRRRVVTCDIRRMASFEPYRSVKRVRYLSVPHAGEE
jgi:hypothetical protein